MCVSMFEVMVFMSSSSATAITPPPTDAHLSYYGGDIIINPVFVNIFWGSWWKTGDGFTERQGVNSFVQTVGTSPQFYSLLGQYPDKNGATTQPGTFFGEFVPPSEPGIPYRNPAVPEINAAITEQQMIDGINSWIDQGLIPAPSPNIVYNLFLPLGVEAFDNADFQHSENSVVDYCAYHDDAISNAGEPYRFIVVPYEDNCAIETVQFATETVDLGHEMIESVNDPDYDVNDPDFDPVAWYDFQKYGEIADICEDLADVTLLGYRIQTIWSNADNTCLATNIPDTIPPAITSSISGTLGSGGWYRGPVSIGWSIVNQTLLTAEQGCNLTTLTQDTASQIISCSATDAGGSATQSITVKIDATPPVITFAGNAGTYTVDQTVAITCRATDALSGIAQSPLCTAHPAYTSNIGLNTLSVSATDNAGNASQASVTFTVTGTAMSLLNLTAQFVETSSRYISSPPAQQAVVRALVTLVEKCLSGILPGLNPKQKAALISTYETDVAALVKSGWLTGSQAAVLDKIAVTL
jgi:hypothetical protein